MPSEDSRTTDRVLETSIATMLRSGVRLAAREERKLRAEDEESGKQAKSESACFSSTKSLSNARSPAE